jgi:hypothetical protein
MDFVEFELIDRPCGEYDRDANLACVDCGEPVDISRPHVLARASSALDERAAFVGVLHAACCDEPMKSGVRLRAVSSGTGLGASGQSRRGPRRAV